MARITYPPVPRVNKALAIERLFWRAGFGPTSADRARYRRRKRTLSSAIESLLRPSTPRYRGSQLRYVDYDGSRHVINVANSGDDTWSQEVLWWLDLMTRTTTPLIERMTLNLHDLFATSMEKVNDRALMLQQNRTLRRHALGSFRTLAHAMLNDGAMKLWLDLPGSTKWDPNENFARELMELFTIGLVYTQRDVEEAARALTGYTYDWDSRTFGWDPDAHDTGTKTIFGHTGNWGPYDVVELCLRHPAHAPFLCRKLWGYFVPTPPTTKRLRQLTTAYKASGYQLRPVLRTIFRSPEFYANLSQPDMVKPPVVHLVGALRSTRAPHLHTSMRWACDDMGQQPFHPPNVAGWHQGEEFLSTGYVKARWDAMTAVNGMFRPVDGSVPTYEKPAHTLQVALNRCGRPWTASTTRSRLSSIATSITPQGAWDTHAVVERRMLLQQLLLAGPDALVH